MDIGGLWTLQCMMFFLVAAGALLKRCGILKEEGKAVLTDAVLFFLIALQHYQLVPDGIRLADTEKIRGGARHFPCWCRWSAIVSVRRSTTANPPR